MAPLLGLMKKTGTLSAALHAGAERLYPLPTARRDAELLLLRAIERDRAWLFAHPEAQLSEAQERRYHEWLARRAQQEPLQYIVGEQEFYGLRMHVTPQVLIPRPETEHVVEALLLRVGQDAALRIADVGTGSGAIAVALAHALPRSRVTAMDISAAALMVAEQNVERHGVQERVRLVQSDLLSAVRGESFDAVVSNPPYIAEGEALEAQVREFEPHRALFAGPTGLEVYERLIPEARRALVERGWLVLEMGHGQQEALTGMLAEWNEVLFTPDLQGIPRVATARRRA